MQKYTHLIFAAVFFGILNFIFHYPIYMSIFAFIGALIPDIDYKFYHRKICHNLWFLLFCNFIGFYFKIFDITVSIIFSIGFISHLFADALTHSGIRPFWPLGPKFHGPIKTGGFGEFLLLCIMIGFVFWIFGFFRF
ncbi:MAG: metal-dependent hydrolase [Candidatus Aenigmatarchaeota archaeon]|nr:metal-dependent hydrolase [Candidatus Aenigmarchaeota archaeon]